MTATTAATPVLFAAMITAGGGRSRASRRVALMVVVLGTGALSAVAATGGAATGGAATGGREPVRRTVWGETKPLNAPGQDMTLQQVVIEPGAQLPEHFHEGTQLASIRSGVLTYHADHGSVAVTRADGSTETVTGPGTVELRRGDWIVEPESLVHYGENRGSKPVVLELVALLHDGAPLSTTTGEVPDTTPLLLETLLSSESRTLYETGPDAATTYGWNRLVGTATVDGREVTIELLASITYTSGSGPFSGFVTVRFPDRSSLALTMQGVTVARPDGADASFAATLGVIGGTGSYVDAAGHGTFTGSRPAELGGQVNATFDLDLGTKEG
jgi:mannose-6-phosphate isomerase-like protein (cupin superfamily)